MRGLLGTTLFSTAALLAAVVLYVWLTLPPAAIALDSRVPATQITGAYHVHTSRSDGTGTPEDIALAASRAGLGFVILTDHGDGTRTPEPPTYRHGVLCIDAVELGTASGHLIALGLTSAAPYPLAGEARDVIDDIHRLGGTAIVAHPDSPKADLRWRGQNISFDGIEWLNADSEWRDDRPARLIATTARAVFRAPEAIASLFTKPSRTLERWDIAAMRRPVFGLLALDAHANIPWRETEEPRQRTAFARPTYETMFRVAGQSVILDGPLSGDAAIDAPRLIRAISTGSSFSIVRAQAGPASFSFTADQGTARTGMGGRLDPAAPLTTLRAAVDDAPGARLILVRDGRPIASGTGHVELVGPTVPGVYRVEASLPGATMPWIMSNPITIGPPPNPVAPIPPPIEEARLTRDAIRPATSASAWAIEREALSSGEVADDGEALRFAYRLGPGQPRGQFAALVTPVDGDAGVDRVQFVGRADRPTRVSLQLKLPGGRDGQRWRRSIFLDSTARRVTVTLDTFEPADQSRTQRPIVADVQTLLFVIDTLNTRPGTQGTVWISDVALGTRKP